MFTYIGLYPDVSTSGFFYSIIPRIFVKTFKMSTGKKQVIQKEELPVLDALTDAKSPEEAKKEVNEAFSAFDDEDTQKLKGLIKKTEGKIATATREPDMYVFKLLLQEGQKPKSYESVVNEMPVYDGASNSVRTIRLIKGASSIWMDEQEGFTPQYIQRNKQDIIFNNGFLRVPKTNRTLLNFLMNSDDYDKKESRLRGKKPKYTLVNSSEVEAAELKKEETRLRAINFAMNASIDDMMIHADFLGIGMMNEFGETKSSAKVRVEYANKAGQSPDYFMSTAGTTASKVQFFVKKALAEGFLDVSSKKGYACWANSGTVICEIPFGKKHYEAISDFALSKSKEATQFYEQVKAAVTGE